MLSRLFRVCVLLAQLSTIAHNIDIMRYSPCQCHLHLPTLLTFNTFYLGAVLLPKASVEPPSLSQKFQNLRHLKSHLTESKLKLPQPPVPPQDDATTASPAKQKVGGSYSRYTGVGGLSRGLTIDGDLVDSSGRRIKTDGMNGDASLNSSAHGGEANERKENVL